MNKYRFSLRFLLGLIGTICVALAMLRYPTYLSSIIVFNVTVAALTLATAGAMSARGEWRAFCLFFALVGWLHLVLAFITWGKVIPNDFLLSRYCLDQLAGPLGVNDQAGSYPKARTALLGVAIVPVNGAPALYYKYIVIGQSLITLFLAAGSGALGQFFYRRSYQDVPHERPV